MKRIATALLAGLAIGVTLTLVFYNIAVTLESKALLIYAGAFFVATSNLWLTRRGAFDAVPARIRVKCIIATAVTGIYVRMIPVIDSWIAFRNPPTGAPPPDSLKFSWDVYGFITGHFFAWTTELLVVLLLLFAVLVHAKATAPGADSRRARTRMWRMAMVATVLAFLRLRIPLEGAVGQVVDAVVIILLLLLAYVSLFQRDRTALPRWTQVGSLSPALYLMLLLLPGPSPSVVVAAPPPPPNRGTFDIVYDVDMRYSGDSTIDVREKITVTPTGVIHAIRVEGVGGTRSLGDTVTPFMVSTDSAAEVQGIAARMRSRITVVTTPLGLLRERVVVVLPKVNLFAQKGAGGAGSDQASDWFVAPIERFDPEVVRNLTVRTPANSLLASYPALEVAPIPDADIGSAPIGMHRDDLELYYLSALHSRTMKKLVFELSGTELLLRLVAWTFGPVCLLLVGIFHRTLADRIMGAFRWPRHKERSPVGFNRS